MRVAGAEQKPTSEWYQNYYAIKGDDRSDPLRNPGVLFQNLAFQKSMIEALRELPGDKRDWKILDVGCGAGFGLLQLLACGLEPEHLHGIELLESRIALGQRRLPALNLVHGDAAQMHYESGSFDLAMESTMLVQITSESTAERIAAEMLRVVRPHGYIMLTDWRYSFRRPGYRAVSGKRIARLFGAGSRTRFVCRKHGALIPALGRFLSRYCPSAYFMASSVFPFLVGQVTVILQKAE